MSQRTCNVCSGSIGKGEATHVECQEAVGQAVATPRVFPNLCLECYRPHEDDAMLCWPCERRREAEEAAFEARMAAEKQHLCWRCQENYIPQAQYMCLDCEDDVNILAEAEEREDNWYAPYDSEIDAHIEQMELEGRRRDAA